VLIADDQKHVLDALEMLLGAHGFSTEPVSHPARVLHALETEQFDAVLMDLNYTRASMEGEEGLELVSRIRSMDRLLPVIVLTAWGSVDLAVEAMRRGASDFVQKPWENHELLRKLEVQLSQARAQRRAERIHDEELHQAREIQDSLLPKTLPQIPGYDVAALNQSLRFVGGDYYSVVGLGDSHAAFCIADVAGKGMPAALLMSTLQAALQPLINQRLPPSDLCHRLNRILCDVMPVGKFISFFFSILDGIHHRLTYCNAGHNPPFLVRADGTSAQLDASGAVLGQFRHWLYEQNELTIGSGDRLLLFTDGLVEACNSNEEPFGENNLLRVARENLTASAADLMTTLIRAASVHCEGHFQDDATLIVLKATETAH
jgi:sigma-B regulation protein RsbU (phosphoserine phosphatase)